uniref:Uncharacterized protein AlNc14C40G3403 n=1 Tax=Albugo laibachii Nc14 TaxID=890382 RepID=F0W9E4_9STRA|nr:conserved hypothetical protein [Albugo laibachii Nc14]|eukprot:CCA17758.1 conserved hypothetical protein [Albugo laibachii Nc14]
MKEIEVLAPKAIGLESDFDDSLRLQKCPNLEITDCMIEYHGNIGCYNCYLTASSATMSYLHTFASQLCVEIEEKTATLTLCDAKWSVVVPQALQKQCEVQIESDHIYLRLSLQKRESREQIGVSTLSRTTMRELDVENYNNIQCRLCRSNIKNPDTKFDRICPLPSDNWLEMQEFWGAGEGAFQHLSRDSITAMKSRVFIADTHILLHTTDVKTDSTTSTDNEIMCGQCGVLLGRGMEDTVLLYKFAISSDCNNIFDSYQVDSMVCVRILETIETEGLFQFRLCTMESALCFTLQVLSWEVRLFSSDTERFDQVLKILYDPECSRIDKNLSYDKAVDIIVPHSSYQQISARLEASTLRVPSSVRKLVGHIGYLYA